MQRTKEERAPVVAALMRNRAERAKRMSVRTKSPWKDGFSFGRPRPRTRVKVRRAPAPKKTMLDDQGLVDRVLALRKQSLDKHWVAEKAGISSNTVTRIWRSNKDRCDPPYGTRNGRAGRGKTDAPGFRERAYALRDQGASIRDICKQMGVSSTAIWKFFKRVDSEREKP